MAILTNNIVLILFFSSAVGIILLWTRYLHTCIEIAATNRVKFFEEAKDLLQSDKLTQEQRERIFKWASSIDSKMHAWAFAIAIGSIYKDVKSGTPLKADKEQKEIYTPDLLHIFTHWMNAQMYSLPFVSLYTKDWMQYILSFKDKAEEQSIIQIEVNKDVFKNEMLCAA